MITIYDKLNTNGFLRLDTAELLEEQVGDYETYMNNPNPPSEATYVGQVPAIEVERRASVAEAYHIKAQDERERRNKQSSENSMDV